VAIPVFSLRSEKSFGVGEFLDLPLLADWARRAGLKLIQILPVNDTSATHTWMDSYPYAAISAFALHPLYLNLDRWPEPAPAICSKAWPPAPTTQRAGDGGLRGGDEGQAGLCAGRFFRRNGSQTLASAEYRKFFAQNKHWLAPYAAFCFLRDKFGTADFNQWPEHRVMTRKKSAPWRRATPPRAMKWILHCFIQFHLHLQLREAADYVHARA
jgi:4-alpha-glucanotransferase